MTMNTAANVTAVAAFLDPAAAAAFLGGMNARTLVRWAREGAVPAFPIGEGKRRLWRFTAKDLTEWMETRRNSQRVPVQKTEYLGVREAQVARITTGR